MKGIWRFQMFRTALRIPKLIVHSASEKEYSEARSARCARPFGRLSSCTSCKNIPSRKRQR